MIVCRSREGGRGGAKKPTSVGVCADTRPRVWVTAAGKEKRRSSLVKQYRTHGRAFGPTPVRLRLLSPRTAALPNQLRSLRIDHPGIYLPYHVHTIQKNTQARVANLQEKVLQASRSLAALRSRGEAAKEMEATLIEEASRRDAEQREREGGGCSR